MRMHKNTVATNAKDQMLASSFEAWLSWGRAASCPGVSGAGAAYCSGLVSGVEFMIFGLVSGARKGCVEEGSLECCLTNLDLSLGMRHEDPLSNALLFTW
jgi:hypothetical protein